MKKNFLTFLSILIALSVMLFSFPLTAFSASDFVVKDGVLYSYNGTSQSVIIPSDVYYIADSAFENNTDITAVDLNNTSVIGNKAFANCVSLKTVTGTGNISSCGAYAFFNTLFQNYYEGKSLVLGSVLVYSTERDDVIVDTSVVSIAPYAFASNTGITSVRIGDTVASVGEGAFYNCTALKEVIVSKYVSYIGAFAFEGTPYLSSAKDEFLVLGNGILVDVNSTASKLTVPDSVKQIGAGAFYNNKTIKTVTIPETVTAVGMRAFAGCTILESAVLPQSLVLLDKEAFYGCTALKKALIPAGVTLVGDSVFFGCSALQSAQVMSKAPLGNGIFANCTGLEYVILSEGVDSIGEYAFYNCSKLKEMSVPPSVTQVHDTAFTGAGGFSVWCKDNSYVEQYCASNGIDFYVIGDSDLDGTVNIRDATAIQKASAKILTMSFSACLRGDADFSGEINIRDATVIQKYIAGVN